MAILPFLTSLLGGGAQGLAQGGGFGLGYGFMVRAGYDLYGQLRDQLTGGLQKLRYVPGASTSMMGTGGLMGLSRTDHKEQPNTTTLNNMTASQRDNLARKIGGAHKLDAYFQSKQIGTQTNGTSQRSPGVRIGNRTFYKQISRHTGKLESDEQFQRRINQITSRQRNRYSFIGSMFNLK